MGILGPMRTHDSRNHCSIDTPSTLCTPTMPSLINPPSSSAPTTTSSSTTTIILTETDSDTLDHYLLTLPPAFTSHTGLVLHLPAEVVPATLNKPQAENRLLSAGGPMGGPRSQADGRTAYRRGPALPGMGQTEAGKDAGVVGDGQVHFHSGAGRGKPFS
ncbi:ribosomal 40S subunit protein S10A [Sparganum proliferum]